MMRTGDGHSLDEALRETHAFQAGVDELENAETTAHERELILPDTTPLDVFGDARLIGSPHFPPGFVPLVLERRAMDVAERLGVDPALVALPMLAVCAAAIDDRVQIYPLHHDTSWKESARLWVAVIADSGQKKTPALNAALAPLRSLERLWIHEDTERTDAYHEASAIYQDAVKLQRKAHAKALATGREADVPALPHPPHKPPIRRKEVKDTTIEALSAVMTENAWGLLAVYDELTGWFGNFDAYRNTAIKRDRSLYLESYNGGPQLIDRVSRGRVYVSNWSLSLVGGIQPDAMRKLAGHITDDGLAQRFVTVFVHEDGISLDRPEDEDAKTDYERLVSRLCSWDIGGPEARLFCRLTSEAHELRELLNRRIRQVCWMPWITKAFQTHLSKWEGLFPRLCLTWHCIEHCGDFPFPETVSLDTAQKVFGFMIEYLLPHAARFYTELLQTKDEEHYARWIAGYILAHDLEKISARDIGRVFRPLRGDIKDIQHTMEHLTAVAWVKPTDTGMQGGHRQWKVNPAVHLRFAVQKKQEKTHRAAMIQHIQDAVTDFPALQTKEDT